MNFYRYSLNPFATNGTHISQGFLVRIKRVSCTKFRSERVKEETLLPSGGCIDGEILVGVDVVGGAIPPDRSVWLSAKYNDRYNQMREEPGERAD